MQEMDATQIEITVFEVLVGEVICSLCGSIL